MKKSIIISLHIVVAFLTATMMTSCEEKDAEKIAVTGVTLEKNTNAVFLGENFILKVNITPENATNKALRWESSNPNVVSINSDGLASARSVGGPVDITVYTVDGGFHAVCKVSVSTEWIPVKGVTVTEAHQPVEVRLGDPMYEIKYTIEPLTANNTTLTLTSSDPAKLVFENGKLKPLKEGQVTVTLTVRNGDNNEHVVSTTCVVAIEDAYDNLMTNPGFEDPTTDNSTTVIGWSQVPQSWFTAYYAGRPEGTGSNFQTTDRIGINQNSGFFNGGNGSYFHTHRIGDWCARIGAGGNNSGGLFQIVDVVPGYKYKFSALIGMRCNDGNATLKDWETVKFLSEDGVTTYHTIPIPISNSFLFDNATGIGSGRPTIVERVEGFVEIPPQVTKLRIQVDQRSFGGTANSPLMLVDDFKFHWFSYVN